MREVVGYGHLETLICRRLGLAPQPAWPDQLAACLLDENAEISEVALAAWRDKLECHGLEATCWQAIAAALTIGETRFLRDREWFRCVERYALTRLVEARRHIGNFHLKLWSAGCSTGEEPYTLALLLHEILPDIGRWSIEIVASDARGEALRHAREGRYEVRQLREIEPHMHRRYFTEDGPRHVRIAKKLSDMVDFRLGNLAEETFAVSERFDLILCRNVLMYMKPGMQRSIAAGMVRALTQDGWLAVSPAEAVAEWYRPMTPVNSPDAILFCKAAAESREAPVSAPQIPSVVQLPNMPPVRPRAPGGGLRPSALADLRLLANRGLREEARLECGRLLANDQLNAEACLLLAEICLELSDLSHAQDAARRAIYLAPSSALAHFLFATALRRRGFFERARLSMRTARNLSAEQGADTAARGDMPVYAGSEVTLRQIHHAAGLFLGVEMAATERARHG